MNKRRREKISKAVNYLKTARDLVDTVMSEEQDAFDSTPESIQDSEKGEKMEEAIGNLDDAIDNIDTAIESLEEAAN